MNSLQSFLLLGGRSREPLARSARRAASGYVGLAPRPRRNDLQQNPGFRMRAPVGVPPYQKKYEKVTETQPTPVNVPTTWKASGVPPHLERLLQEAEFPSPTKAQASLLSAVIRGDRDVFLMDYTGRGKTLALVLLAISHILKPNRSRAASSAKGPQVLVLLPNATLLHQVETWLKEFLPPSLVAKEGQEIIRTIFPNDRDSAERIEQIPRIVLSTPSALWARINPDSTKPLDAASTITKQPISDNWLSSASLARSLEMVMVDEPDDVLSPLPGRFDKPRRNARGVQEDRWGKHVPIGVKLLRTLLPGRSGEGDERQARNKRVQTVWTSATLNSRVRAWVTMEGWARPAGEGGLVLDFTKNTGDQTTGEGNTVRGEDAQQASQREVDHVCLVVDPLTGKARDMNDSEPEEIRSVPSAVDPDSPIAFDEGKGDVHPLLLEALALDWATSTESGSSGGESLVLPPSGTSIPRLQAQLAELDCPSVSLDVDSKETAADLGKDLDGGVDEAKEGRLLILPRSHIRGIDIPNVRTVYILGGLGVGSKRGPSTAGMWAERERDYQHWAGRMGRLSRSNHDQDQEKDGKGKVVTIVMQGEEERAMQKLLESRRVPRA